MYITQNIANCMVGTSKMMVPVVLDGCDLISGLAPCVETDAMRWMWLLPAWNACWP